MHASLDLFRGLASASFLLPSLLIHSFALLLVFLFCFFFSLACLLNRPPVVLEDNFVITTYSAVVEVLFGFPLDKKQCYSTKV